MKRKLIVCAILPIMMFLLLGCTEDKVDILVMDGWELKPANPVVNESVNIHIKYSSASDTLGKTVLFHWVITEGVDHQTQSSYTTLGSDLRLAFDTPGKKEVLVWTEGINYGEKFSSPPFFFYFDVPEL